MTSKKTGYKILDSIISDDEKGKKEIEILLQNYFSKTYLPRTFTMYDLAEHCYKSTASNNYEAVRYFVKKTQERLKLENKDLLTVGLALIFNEGLDVKKDCSEIHPTYRTGGAYLFSREFLTALMLAKSPEFRTFVRMQKDNSGKNYEVPLDLKNRDSRIIDYLLVKEAK